MRRRQPNRSGRNGVRSNGDGRSAASAACLRGIHDRDDAACARVRVDTYLKVAARTDPKRWNEAVLVRHAAAGPEAGSPIGEISYHSNLARALGLANATMTGLANATMTLPPAAEAEYRSEIEGAWNEATAGLTPEELQAAAAPEQPQQVPSSVQGATPGPSEHVSRDSCATPSAEPLGTKRCQVKW